MSVIDEIKSRIDAVDLISETVQLRRTGKNYSGFCPFHSNLRTPAFVVFPESGTWRCFGQCNEGGDVFKFLMKKEGWDFSQTLHVLAERAGVTLTPMTPEKQAEEEEHVRLRALLEEAVTFFHHHLINTPAGRLASAYLQKRGLKPETIEAFGLGYAPEAWEALTGYFQSKGYSTDELLQAGLVTERQGGEGVYDKFRHRVMFPIRDALGKITGFGGRVLNPEDQPKFMNSPQTALFDKGRLLYGLDLARKAIRAQNQVVIVEGYLDVIALHQGGFVNVVSPMGTALTEDQLRMLKRLTRKIVLALDPDAAGQKATLRGLEMARQAMDRTAERTYDPSGLLRQQARLDADLRVTTLPEGMDPDEIVLRDPQEWAHIVEAAKPILFHVMETLVADREIDDPKVKGEIAAQVLPLIEDVPNSFEREDYRQKLARLLRVDERSLVGAGAPARPARRRTAAQHAPGSQTAPLAAVQPVVRPEVVLEAHILRLLLRQPDAVYLLDRQLQKAGVSRFSVQDFEQADHQMLAALLIHSLEQDHIDAAQFIQENMPETLNERAHELLQPFAQGEPTQESLVEDLIHSVMRLRRIRTHAHVEQLIFMQSDVQQDAGSHNLEDYQGIHEVVLQCTRVVRNLDRALGQPIQLD